MKKLLNGMIIFLLAEQTCFGMCSVDGILAQQTPHETSILNVVGALAFVIGLIFLTGLIYTKLNVVGSNLAKKTRNNEIEDKVIVLSSTHLNNNQSLHVVEVNGKKLLLGATQSSVTVLKDLGEVKNFKEEVKTEDLVKEEKPALDEIFENTDVAENQSDNSDDDDFGLYKKYL